MDWKAQLVSSIEATVQAAVQRSIYASVEESADETARRRTSSFGEAGRRRIELAEDRARRDPVWAEKMAKRHAKFAATTTIAASVKPQAIFSGVDIAATTPATCSTQCPSRAITESVSALIPSVTPSSSTTTGVVVPERCCFDPGPAAVTSTPTSFDVSGALTHGVISTTSTTKASVSKATSRGVSTEFLLDSIRTNKSSPREGQASSSTNENDIIHLPRELLHVLELGAPAPAMCSTDRVDTGTAALLHMFVSGTAPGSSLILVNNQFSSKVGASAQGIAAHKLPNDEVKWQRCPPSLQMWIEHKGEVPRPRPWPSFECTLHSYGEIIRSMGAVQEQLQGHATTMVILELEQHTSTDKRANRQCIVHTVDHLSNCSCLEHLSTLFEFKISQVLTLHPGASGATTNILGIGCHMFFHRLKVHPDHTVRIAISPVTNLQNVQSSGQMGQYSSCVILIPEDAIYYGPDGVQWEIAWLLVFSPFAHSIGIERKNWPPPLSIHGYVLSHQKNEWFDFWFQMLLFKNGTAALVFPYGSVALPWDPCLRCLVELIQKRMVSLSFLELQFWTSFGTLLLVPIVMRIALDNCHGTVMLGKVTGEGAPILQYFGSLHKMQIPHHSGSPRLYYCFLHAQALGICQFLDLSELHWQHSSCKYSMSESFPWYIAWLLMVSSCAGSDSGIIWLLDLVCSASGNKSDQLILPTMGESETYLEKRNALVLPFYTRTVQNSLMVIWSWPYHSEHCACHYPTSGKVEATGVRNAAPTIHVIEQVHAGHDYYFDCACYFDNVHADDNYYYDAFLDRVDHRLGLFNLIQVLVDHGYYRNCDNRERQVQWDPGGSTWHRLEVKPKFKEEGNVSDLSCCLYCAGLGLPLLGLGCWDDTHDYKYRQKRYDQLGWERTASASSASVFFFLLLCSSLLCYG